jgi:hypothetical protein
VARFIHYSSGLLREAIARRKKCVLLALEGFQSGAIPIVSLFCWIRRNGRWHSRFVGRAVQWWW